MSLNLKNFPVLTSERLTLREINLNDAEPIFELRTNKEINTFITRDTPKNLNEAKEFIKMIINLVHQKKGILWVIESKKQKKVIGSIGLRHFEIAENYAEIGYELHPKHHQKGLMSEAMKTVLDFGIKKMKLKTIEAFTHKNNTASIALLKKHHFIYQPERKDLDFDDNKIWQLQVNKDET